jgi:hypothetical protein
MNQKVEEYFTIIDSDPKEQVVQEFLERNTDFIPRHFVQNHGIHNQLVIRKLPLSSEYVTDLFLMSKSTDDWNYILIELERPSSKFFKDGKNDIHPNFSRAIQQIRAWQGWFLMAANKSHFENQLAYLKKPIPDTPVYIKYVLVFGRRSEIDGNKKRLNMIKTHEGEDFKIMTFDSLAEDISRKDRLYLGVKKSGHVEIHSTDLIDIELFRWNQMSDLRVREQLKSAALSHCQSIIDGVTNRTFGSLLVSQWSELKDEISKVITFNE